MIVWMKSWVAWASQVEVTPSADGDHWIVEMRISILREDKDPLHQAIGRKPIPGLPCHINFCRQRLRNPGVELSVFFPASAPTLHEPLKIARLFEG